MTRLQTTVFFAALLSAASADGRMIGINMVLSRPPTADILADLGTYGDVLDVIPEISAVTLRADSSTLQVIQGLPYVAAANADARRCSAGTGGLPVSDLAGGANLWNLDAINVTDFGVTRTVGYDGQGVYIAVIDTGLPYNWRAYFPEERIDALHARSFGGGGGQRGTVSEQPETWERDTFAHGTAVTSVILGFSYYGTYYNGAAPKATVIPICLGGSRNGWSSVATRAVVYVANLKISGALGDAPVVINLSQGGPSPDAIERAAIDYAIASGVVVVAAAGNEAGAGMRYPAAHPPVISAAASAWVRQFPADDPTHIWWILRDVPETDIAEHFIAPFSAYELPGQDLDVAAPGYAVPVAWTQNGQVDYSFFVGTSAACPHVAGIAALMLQKNPALTPAQIETILENTAMPLPAGCRDTTLTGLGVGRPPTWSDFGIVFFFDATVCWESNTTGTGLVQADAALAATPAP